MSSLTEDVLVGEHSVRPFLFGEVHLTGWYLSHCILEFIMNYYLDDESALSTRSYEELGTIKVKIHRITDCRSRRSSASAACFQVPENSKVHERAKKSATHQVMWEWFYIVDVVVPTEDQPFNRFGQIKMIEKQQKYTNFRCQEKVATFVFQYQSLGTFIACYFKALTFVIRHVKSTQHCSIQTTSCRNSGNRSSGRLICFSIS